MEKPITVVREEFIQNLVNLINDSKLPPFVITPILSSMLSEVKNHERIQYENDLSTYNQSLKNAE